MRRECIDVQCKPRVESVSFRFAFDIPTADHAADGVLATIAGGERVDLHAERALHWRRERTLFVADVHLGKGAAFRASGVPIPRGSTAADLARLTRLIERSAAARIVILGDFLHAKRGRVAALAQAFVAWRSMHESIDIILVRGNHDAHAGDPPGDWHVRVVDAPHAIPPFIACHAPESPASGYALCGHVHPGVLLETSSEHAWLPCFVIGARRAILPAFGRFTGLARFVPEPMDRVVAIAGPALFTLPTHGDVSQIRDA